MVPSSPEMQPPTRGHLEPPSPPQSTSAWSKASLSPAMGGSVFCADISDEVSCASPCSPVAWGKGAARQHSKGGGGAGTGITARGLLVPGRGVACLGHPACPAPASPSSVSSRAQTPLSPGPCIVSPPPTTTLSPWLPSPLHAHPTPPLPRTPQDEDEDRAAGNAVMALVEPGPPPPKAADARVVLSTVVPGTSATFFSVLLATESHFMEDFLESQGNRWVGCRGGCARLCHATPGSAALFHAPSPPSGPALLRKVGSKREPGGQGLPLPRGCQHAQGGEECARGEGGRSDGMVTG